MGLSLEVMNLFSKTDPQAVRGSNLRKTGMCPGTSRVPEWKISMTKPWTGDYTGCGTWLGMELTDNPTLPLSELQLLATGKLRLDIISYAEDTRPQTSAGYV